MSRPLGNDVFDSLLDDMDYPPLPPAEQPDTDVELETVLYPFQVTGADLLWCGTCQSCGMYWDVRQRKICTCGGEVL